MTNSDGLVDIFFLPNNASEHLPPATIVFQNNLFMSNSFSSPRAANSIDYSMVINLAGSTIPINVNGNIIAQNSLPLTSPGPYLAPVAGFSYCGTPPPLMPVSCAE